MIYESLGAAGLDYQPCRYGDSRLLFRGPYRAPEGSYVAFLGGSETYGRFLARPFPALLEQAAGIRAVNLGCVTGGLDVYLDQPGLVDIVAGADRAVIQVMGAQNVSNRFYTVHPRRNDRFLAASRFLQTIYPEVDFAQVNFTRHLLTELHARADHRFALVRDELRAAWVARMTRLLDRIGGRPVLLWLSARPPEHPADAPDPAEEPLFVTREMLDAFAGRVDLVEVTATRAEIASGRAGLAHTAMERLAAAEMLGPVVHARVAAALVPHLQRPSHAA